jgi:hypothetical protein
MAVTSKFYGLSLVSLFTAKINWTGGNVKALLLTNAYTPNQDTHQYKSDLTNELPTANGYTLRGQAITTAAVTYDGATNTVKITCDNPSWPSSTLTARYLVFYQDTGTDSTSPLIAYVDFGADVSSTAAAFTYQVPGTGVGTDSVA